MAAFDDKQYEIASIVALLQKHDFGAAVALADAQYHQAIAACTEIVGEHKVAAKAKLKIELEISVDANGVDVVITPTLAALPKPPKTKSRYFVNGKGDALSLMNPNQGTFFPNADLGRAGRAG